MKIKKLFRTLLAAACGLAVTAQEFPARASTLEGSTLYTGTSALVSDVMGVLTVLCPLVCGVFAIGFAIRRGMADEQDGKIWQRRIVTAIVCGVLGGLIAGIISLIASYYA